LPFDLNYISDFSKRKYISEGNVRDVFEVR
jgi:hypothetical protein